MSDTTAEATHVLGLRASYPVPPAAVFRALTDPDVLHGWLAEEAEVP